MAQVGGRVGGELLQAVADEPVGGVDGFAEPLAVGLLAGQLPPRDGQVLRQPVVDLGRERAPLALHRRAQQLAAQTRGGDAGGQLQAEQAQDGPAQRVDPDRAVAEAMTTPTISVRP